MQLKSFMMIEKLKIWDKGHVKWYFTWISRKVGAKKPAF
jgi:hypothetical protein